MNVHDLIGDLSGKLFINGSWLASSDGNVFPVENPANEALLGLASDGTIDDAVKALAAADDAFASWSATPARVRSELLRQLHYAVVRDSEILASIITLEMGKSLTEAKGEVAYAADFLRWFSEEAPRLTGQYGDAPTGNGRIVTRFKPVGPALLVTPWNFPLAMLARKIGPALAAGCTTVIKPASATPFAAYYLAKLAQEVGVPDGVINVVSSSKASGMTKRLLSDSRLRKISFTGSTSVGKALTAEASQHMVRVSMELGGNAPFIVLEDADIELSVEQAVVAKLRNIGQSCVAGNRFLVHRSLASRFAEKLAARFEHVQIGNGMDEGVELGPLINREAREAALEHVSVARQEGATVLTGGRALGDKGYFFAPTVIADVSMNSSLVNTELFAPIAPICVFEDEQSVIDQANNTEYGLAAYVFSADVDRALRFSDRIQSGIVGINRGVVSDAAAPFGGVKQSGVGREGGPTGIFDYTETQYVGLPPGTP